MILLRLESKSLAFFTLTIVILFNKLHHCPGRMKEQFKTSIKIRLKQTKDTILKSRVDEFVHVAMDPTVDNGRKQSLLAAINQVLEDTISHTPKASGTRESEALIDTLRQAITKKYPNATSPFYDFFADLKKQNVDLPGNLKFIQKQLPVIDLVVEKLTASLRQFKGTTDTFSLMYICCNETQVLKAVKDTLDQPYQDLLNTYPQHAEGISPKDQQEIDAFLVKVLEDCGTSVPFIQKRIWNNLPERNIGTLLKLQTNEQEAFPNIMHKVLEKQIRGGITYQHLRHCIIEQAIVYQKRLKLFCELTNLEYPYTKHFETLQTKKAECLEQKPKLPNIIKISSTLWDDLDLPRYINSALYIISESNMRELNNKLFREDLLNALGNFNSDNTDLKAVFTTFASLLFAYQYREQHIADFYGKEPIYRISDLLAKRFSFEDSKAALKQSATLRDTATIEALQEYVSDPNFNATTLDNLLCTKIAETPFRKHSLSTSGGTNYQTMQHLGKTFGDATQPTRRRAATFQTMEPAAPSLTPSAEAKIPIAPQPRPSLESVPEQEREIGTSASSPSHVQKISSNDESWRTRFQGRKLPSIPVKPDTKSITGQTSSSNTLIKK